MTFDEIVTEIKDRLNLTSSEATTRVGRGVNRIYKRVTTTCSMNLTRNVVGVSANTSIGSSLVTFANVEKITRVYDDSVSSERPRELREMTLMALRELNVRESDQARFWAVQSTTDNDVVVRLDIEALSVFALKADGLSTVATLSGSQVPVIPESFHDILIVGVLIDEYQKMEKPVFARDAKMEFEQRMSELRYFLAKNAYIDSYQNSKPPRRWYEWY